MRQRGKTLGLVGMVLTGVMSLVGGTGCDNDEVFPNLPPYSSATPSATADEKTSYTENLNPQDDDGDLVTCTANVVPAGANVTPDGDVTWTPTNDQSNEFHAFSVKLNDGTDDTYVDWDVYVNGTGAPKFNIESAGPRAKLPNVKVTLEGLTSSNVYEVTTGADGVAQFPEIDDEDYNVIVTDMDGNHETHRAGTLVVSKDKETQSKLENLFRLYLKADADGIDDTVRYDTPLSNDVVRRAAQPFMFRIYTSQPDGTPVDSALINDFIADIEGPVATFYQTTYSDGGADPNIVTVDSPPPTSGDADFVPPNGVIYAFFDDNGPLDGGNTSNIDGSNNVLSGKAFAKTTASRGVRIQELIEARKDGAETEEFANSIFKNSPSDTLQPKDLVISDVYHNRPTGNQDFESPEFRDVTPSEYVVNQ